MKNRLRLLRVTTVPISLKILLQGQLSFFKHHGFNVLAVSADGPELASLYAEGIRHEVVPMTRKITPFQDFLCLLQLIRIIRKFRPDIVHTHTPKAGFLGMIAAKICGVKVRMHTVAGMPLMETRGIKRWLLVLAEKITYRCAHKVYPNSQGLFDFITREFNIPPYTMTVIGQGSSNGIDTRFFHRTEGLMMEAKRIREQYSIQPNDIVFSFVGRIVRDKGVGELVEAFKKLINYDLDDSEEIISVSDKPADSAELTIDNSAPSPEVTIKMPYSGRLFLLLIGAFEQDLNPLNEEDLEFLQEHPQVILAGFQIDVRPWIVASDIFVFPSYREGFPNVVMQACCLEVPCIVSDINGCNEIIEHHKTGLIVPPKDANSLYDAMTNLVDDEELRRSFGGRAREHVKRNFDQMRIWSALLNEYSRMLIEPSSKPISEAGRRYKRITYLSFYKPLIDKAIALTILLAASPFLLISALVLAIANKGKVWFIQPRPGKDEKIFHVVKFKTMTDNRDESGNLLPDDQRLTFIGKIIRKTSLDELPQLVNVLKGDMSLVGPRPLLVSYLPLYNNKQRKRHCVKPGITGWAQINGRNTLSWQQKFDYDVWYVDNLSFGLDIKILFLTLLKVFKAEGITSRTSETMEQFKGNNSIDS